MFQERCLSGIVGRPSSTSSFDENNDHRLTEEEFRDLLSQEDYDTRFTMDLY